MLNTNGTALALDEPLLPLYVTWFCRTPPCVDAIVRAGIIRVVALCPDPNPLVRGGGLSALRARGIQTAWGPRRAEAEALLAPWLASLPVAQNALGTSPRVELAVWKP